MAGHRFAVGDEVHRVVRGEPVTRYILVIEEVLPARLSDVTRKPFFPYRVWDPRTGLISHASDEFLTAATGRS